MTFLDPKYLGLLVLILPVAYLCQRWKAKRMLYTNDRPDLVNGTDSTSKKHRRSSVFGRNLNDLVIWLRTAALVMLVVALARPAIPNHENRSSNHVEGIDILLAIDASGSMRAIDFELEGERATRLDTVKAVVKDFIAKRPFDRIGVVIFGTHAYTLSPLTTDHGLLLKFLDRVEIGVAGEETAIGDGLALSAKRFVDDESAAVGGERIVVLLTDGENTAGKIDPRQAADLAKSKDLKVYTIGVGRNGIVPAVHNGMLVRQRVRIDEDLLQGIAQKTGGKYFNASNTAELNAIYQEINQLETRELNDPALLLASDLYVWFALAGLGFLLLELLYWLSPGRRLPA